MNVSITVWLMELSGLDCSGLEFAGVFLNYFPSWQQSLSIWDQQELVIIWQKSFILKFGRETTNLNKSTNVPYSSGQSVYIDHR